MLTNIRGDANNTLKINMRGPVIKCQHNGYKGSCCSRWNDTYEDVMIQDAIIFIGCDNIVCDKIGCDKIECDNIGCDNIGCDKRAGKMKVSTSVSKQI